VLRSKNEWSYTSTPQYAFMAWCSVKKSTWTTLPLPLHTVLLCSALLHGVATRSSTYSHDYCNHWHVPHILVKEYSVCWTIPETVGLEQMTWCWYPQYESVLQKYIFKILMLKPAAGYKPSSVVALVIHGRSWTLPSKRRSTGCFVRNGVEPAVSTVGPNGENGLYIQTCSIRNDSEHI